MSSLPDLYFKMIKRLFPVNVQRSAVGLDISPFSCKAVEIFFKNGRFELLRWAMEPIPEPDDALALAALGRIVSAFDLHVKPRPVIASLYGKGTLVRYVDMPKMSQADLRRAFVIEADKYFPFPKDTVHTDCHILDSFDGNRKMSVLVAAVKKDLVEGRMKQLKDAGVEPLALALNAVALANAFTVFPPAGFSSAAGIKEFKACAVVDIGETGANLMILFAGFPRFNRDIFIGTQEIYKRVSNILGCSPAEARTLLTPGAELKEPVQKSVEAVMAGLTAEIKLSFDYFVTEKNVAITQIFLAGDGALIPGVEASFRESIDIPVGIWDPFENMALGVTALKEGLKLNSPRLITALGLALNEYDQS